MNLNLLDLMYEGEFNAAGLAIGVCIYRMKVNVFIASNKMILLK